MYIYLNKRKHSYFCAFPGRVVRWFRNNTNIIQKYYKNTIQKDYKNNTKNTNRKS